MIFRYAKEPWAASHPPVVRVNGVRYFVDIRMRQLRRVDDPRSTIDFEWDN